MSSAKRIINIIGGSQGKCITTCPRCGGKMHKNLHLNALSRYENIYICSDCGMDEALRDMAGLAPLPIEIWACMNLRGEK